MNIWRWIAMFLSNRQREPCGGTCVNGPVHKERSIFGQFPAVPGSVDPRDLEYLFLLFINMEENSVFLKFWFDISALGKRILPALTLLTQIRPWILPLLICSSSHGRIRCLSIGIFTLLVSKCAFIDRNFGLVLHLLAWFVLIVAQLAEIFCLIVHFVIQTPHFTQGLVKS